MRDPWISTGKANRILNSGICDDTFREKLQNSVRWKRTPGGQFRWNREDVEALARKDEEPELIAS